MTNIPVLFKIMKERNITHDMLSKAINVSTGNISDWKSGRSNPSMFKLLLIADYLECSVDYLLGRTDNPEVNK